MNFENIKDWKDLARKFNFREKDFTKEFVDDITSGSFVVGRWDGLWRTSWIFYL